MMLYPAVISIIFVGQFENGSAAMDREEELPATQTAPPPSTEGTN